MICHICGKPTTAREFYTLPSGRRWAHVDCMLEAGKKLIARGELDHVRAAIEMLDGTTSVRSGKQLREDWNKKDEAKR